MNCRSKKEVMHGILSYLRILSKLAFSSIFSRSFSWCWYVLPTNLSLLCYGICDIFFFTLYLFLVLSLNILLWWEWIWNGDESGFKMERSVGSRSREWWNLFMLFINTQFFYIFLLSCLFNWMSGLIGVLCDFSNIMHF